MQAAAADQGGIGGEADRAEHALRHAGKLAGEEAAEPQRSHQVGDQYAEEQGRRAVVEIAAQGGDIDAHDEATPERNADGDVYAPFPFGKAQRLIDEQRHAHDRRTFDAQQPLAAPLRLQAQGPHRKRGAAAEAAVGKLGLGFQSMPDARLQALIEPDVVLGGRLQGEQAQQIGRFRVA